LLLRFGKLYKVRRSSSDQKPKNLNSGLPVRTASALALQTKTTQKP